MLTIPPLIGHTISGYKVEQPLVQGQASVAFRMRHVISRQPATFIVAMLPEMLPQTTFTAFMERFTSLAAQLTALSHQHLLAVLDYGEYYGYPYLITENTEGVSVATLLQRYGKYTPEGALPVLKQVASALDYAHAQGLVHGNLRPATLHLLSDRQLQLTGLSMVHLLEARGIAESNQSYAHLRNMMGTYLSDPAYLSPEYVQGRPASARSDIYALGLLLFELLSGQPPFSGDTYLDIALQHIQEPPPSFSSHCPELQYSPEFDTLLSYCLSYIPEQRFEQAAHLVTAYEDILQRREQVSLSTVNNNAVFLSKPVERETTGQHSFTAPPDQGLHFESVQQQTIRQLQRRPENQDALISDATTREKTTSANALSAMLTQRQQDYILYKQIEAYIWNEQKLPVLHQTEPMLLAPAKSHLFANLQGSRLSWRGVIYLALFVGSLILGALGAWSIEKLHHPVQPVQPHQQQRRGQQQEEPFIMEILQHAALSLSDGPEIAGDQMRRWAKIALPLALQRKNNQQANVVNAKNRNRRCNLMSTTFRMCST